MCVNRTCMAVASLRASKNKCPQDCNGNGVCNSLGHCHCKDGFSPPFCDYPGPGGSQDSGPASDPNARKDFVMAMYIVFLGIIPIIAIVSFLMYYTKYNVDFKWQKTGIPTYVLNCFSSVKHAVSNACCNIKKTVVPTISQRVSNRPRKRIERNIHLEIEQKCLTFTTNDMLNAGSQNHLVDIPTSDKRRMSFKAIRNKVNSFSSKGKKDFSQVAHNSKNLVTVVPNEQTKNIRNKVNSFSSKSKKDSSQVPQSSKNLTTIVPKDENILSVKELREQFQKGGGSIC